MTWLLIRDGCVLLERCEKKARVLGVGEWFVPGGKIEGDETDEQALRREIAEEWPDVQLSGWTPLPIVEGSPVPPGPRGLFLMRPFLITASGYYPDKSADGVELRWTPIAEALASPVLQVRMMVAAAMESRAAATSAEPVAWGIRAVGKVRFFRMFDAAQGVYAAESLADLNSTAGLDPSELVPLYAAPAPQVAALREEVKRQREVETALRTSAATVFQWLEEAQSQVASLSAALEAITERSSYPIDPRDAFEEALSRARAALPTGDATRDRAIINAHHLDDDAESA